MILKIERKRPNVNIPKKGTPGSAGLDLCAYIDHPLILTPGHMITVPTGIAIELPSNEYAGFIFARSGLGTKYGIALSNGVGIIDSDYRGEIFVGLSNVSSKNYQIEPGERVAQLIVMPIANLQLMEVDSLSPTERGINAFGSTGK